MKRQSINPQDGQILDLFTRDTIDRSADVVRFCNLVNRTEGCFTIAINGAWGSGKTIFVRQAKTILDYLNGSLLKDNPLTSQIESFLATNTHIDGQLLKVNNTKSIYYDAWENDNDIDPVLSIIFSIINSRQFSLKEKQTHNLGEILSSIAEVISGRNVTAFFQAAKGDNFLSSIKQQKAISELTNDFFKSIIESSEERLVIFIDELDRCKPSYAITLLERIKHYFNNDNLIFVFSVNLDQLQHTVRTYYGLEFDASRYLDKFFDLIMQLPPYNSEKFLNSLQFRDRMFISRKVSRAVIKSLNLQMREQEKYIQLVKISGLEELTQKLSTSFADDRAYFFSMAYVLPLILGLQIVNIKVYNEFISGTNFIPLVSLLSNLDVRMLERSGLLNKNETFLSSSENKGGLKQVSVNEVASKLSEILFRNNYENEFQYTIGSMTFGKEVRADLLRNACLLSKYAEY